MPSLPMLCILLAACFGLITSSLQASEIENTKDLVEWDSLAFNIKDSKCRVGIASVKLSVSTLKPEDGNLVGEYSITVPLMTSKNDKGRIVLPLQENNVNDIGEKGGVLRGKAISYQEGKTPNGIVCEVLPLDNKTILLEITTDDHTLEFKSSYTVSKEAAGS